MSSHKKTRSSALEPTRIDTTLVDSDEVINHSRAPIAGPSTHLGERMRQLILRASPSAVNTIGDLLRFAVQQQLSDDEALLQLVTGLGVGADGWPTDPLVRRRLRVERFYQLNAIPIDMRRVEAVLAGEYTEDQIMSTLYRKYERNEVGESLDPDIALGENLLHIFACTKPELMEQVPQFLEEREGSGWTHEQYLDEVCTALGVCTDGWPYNPDDRLRSRLTSFYRHNDPKKVDRVAILMERDFSEEEIFAALYEKYGRDELGQPVQTERMLREQLRHLLQPTGKDNKIEELIAYKKQHRLTDVELILEAKKLLQIGQDGLPLDVTQRMRTRILNFFKLNSNPTIDVTVTMPPLTAEEVSAAAEKHHHVAPMGGTSSASHHNNAGRSPVSPDTMFSYSAALTTTASRLQHSSPIPHGTPVDRRPPPKFVSPPPLLSPSEWQELLSDEEHQIIDDLIVTELMSLRGGVSATRVDKSGDSSSKLDLSQKNAKRRDDQLPSSFLKKASMRVASLLAVKKEDHPSTTQQKQKPESSLADDDPSGGSVLSTITSEEEEAIMHRVCLRFHRNELGEVLLPDKDRVRIRLELIQFVERYIRHPQRILDVCRDLSQLRVSEENIWIAARRRFQDVEEHTQWVQLRDHLTVMLSRCWPGGDIPAKVSEVMLTMYEDDLTPEEMFATIQRKFGVDRDGWPVDAVQRRRSQLTMLFARHDPQRARLIDTLYMSMPYGDSDKGDRLYWKLCSEFGQDELGRPLPSAVEELAVAAVAATGAETLRMNQPLITDPSTSTTSNVTSFPQGRRFHAGRATNIAASNPLRDMQVQNVWGGDAAAADVAAVIGEDYLKQLQQKYGREMNLGAMVSGSHNSVSPLLSNGAVTQSHSGGVRWVAPTPSTSAISSCGPPLQVREDATVTPLERMRRETEEVVHWAATTEPSLPHPSIASTSFHRRRVTAAPLESDLLHRWSPSRNLTADGIDWESYLPEEKDTSRSSAASVAPPLPTFVRRGTVEKKERKLEWVDS